MNAPSPSPPEPVRITEADAVEVSRQIAGLDLHDRVELAGPRPRAEVLDEMRRSAAIAAPCIVGRDGNRDGLPTVLLEAMAVGTPTIATDVTGIPELVRNGETGLLVPQNDAEVVPWARLAAEQDTCPRLYSRGILYGRRLRRFTRRCGWPTSANACGSGSRPHVRRPQAGVANHRADVGDSALGDTRRLNTGVIGS